MRNYNVLKIAPAFLLLGTMLHAQQSDSVKKETEIEQVVLIGYGKQKKTDLTGSITSVSEKDFNKGAMVSADQLIMGKAAGVRITNTGGSPNASPNIVIRGGGSLSASNQPLIVIDGVPIAIDNPAGINNPFLLVNPNDIESFSILKDASATAIYGSRASAGVIIITTKKGTTGKPKFSYNANISLGQVYKYMNVMNSDEFVRFVTENRPNDAWKLGVGGSSDNPTTPGKIYATDWQKEVLRNSISTDHTFSASAALPDGTPIRASLGYNRTEGVVKMNNLDRYTASIKITPTFFDKHLKIDINSKSIWVTQNAIDEGSVLGAAIAMDPTKPVYAVDNSPSSTRFGEYYQYLSPEKVQATGEILRYIKAGSSNPVADLYQRHKPQSTSRYLNNIEFDYKTHFLPELRAVVNLGYDYSVTKLRESFDNNSISQYNTYSPLVKYPNDYFFYNGFETGEDQTMKNKLMDAYLVYNKANKDSFISNFLIQGGYSYQDFVNDGSKIRTRLKAGTQELEYFTDSESLYYNRYNLQSFFGRSNIDILDKYLFTLTFRADASSLFQGLDKTWGYFPAVGFAWKATSEEWIKNLNIFSELKLRAGWGLTGQQNIQGVVGYYPSRPLFIVGSSVGQYLGGLNTYTAAPFNNELTWEKAETYNIGIDFSSKNRRISGSVEYYNRRMTDLLSRVNYPAGQFLTNTFVKNAGEMLSKGVEASLTVTPVKTMDFTWDVNANIAYNDNKIESLDGQTFVAALTDANLPSGTGAVVRQHFVGYQPAAAFVFQQVYDQNGNPLQNVFVDRNGDGIINDSDKYILEIVPKTTFGFGTNFNYKNWDLSASFHGQIGGMVHNSRKLSQGFVEQAATSDGLALNNVVNFYDGISSFNFTNRPNDQMQLSDYFYEDASFLRCDNITLGYRFTKLLGFNNVRLYGTVNNAFIITKYTGQDPESPSTFDNNIYPRPRIYTFGLNLNF
ncbi:SusC/RagA family TonB-linked outer membrane protein [Epilithonimonas sp.]|uniref:SusC/RagA family TonB-linked outer membrane protein n=1 Tax=Epilithonimonas sp. TaxID=2894511 RepID=UPI0035B482E3